MCLSKKCHYLRQGDYAIGSVYYLRQGDYAIGSVYYLRQGDYAIGSVYLFICPSVCLSVCGPDFSETTGRIFIKFQLEIDLHPKTTPFNFGDDPDPDLDSGSKSGSELFSGISRKLTDGSS